MLTLNRKSELYQNLFDKAMTRLNRVPKELLKPLEEPTPNYGSKLVPYIFERAELELPVEQRVGNGEIFFGEFLCKRLTHNQAVAYDRNCYSWQSMPFETVFGGEVLAALMWIVFKQGEGHLFPFDLRCAAHRAVILYSQALLGGGAQERRMMGKTFFGQSAHRMRANFALSDFLNNATVSMMDSMAERQKRQLTPSLSFRQLVGQVRFPVQSPTPFQKEGHKFYQFPFSYNEYSDAFSEAVMELFLEAADTKVSAEDRALVVAMTEQYGKPEDIVKEIRVSCFNCWLVADEVGPLKAARVAKEALSKYREFFAAVYRVENATPVTYEF